MDKIFLFKSEVDIMKIIETGENIELDLDVNSLEYLNEADKAEFYDAIGTASDIILHAVLTRIQEENKEICSSNSNQ